MTGTRVGRGWAGLVGLAAAGLVAAAVLAQPGTTTTTTTSRDGTTTTTTVVRPAGEPVPIVPQVRWRHRHESYRVVELTGIAASVEIDEQVAATTLELTLHNPTGANQEAVLMLPVPEGASVRSLQYDGTGSEPTAKILRADEARRIYDSIVSSMRDPALLEFAGYNMIRTSAFPVPAGASQKLRVTYEEVLASDAGRVDYALPRSQALAETDAKWSISATIRSKGAISTVYSPSHEIATERLGSGRVTVKTTAQSLANPGSFRMSFLMQRGEGVTGTFLAYPDATVGDNGGYFLLLGGLPAEMAKGAKARKREVVIVIDRSGSMRGEKFNQAKEAATQVVEGLEDGEAFNVIDYSDSISSFSPAAVIKTRETMAGVRQYISAIEAQGGTNLRDAVIESLRARPTEGMLPLVLFLTDGLPTVGVTSEVQIRDDAKAANAHNRRVFTFGVGHDVNAPLLSNLARTTRAASTFVLPEENVEVKVSQVFRRLSGPVLAMPTLAAVGPDGGAAARAMREVLPSDLPDLFDGDQLVVIGQYLSDTPLRLKLTGDFVGQARAFEFEFDPAAASMANSFVPRLWASRRIAVLVDQIRQAGAVGDVMSDPKTKELVDEIVRLSVKHGILTEYTAFLATDPTIAAAQPAEGSFSFSGGTRVAGEQLLGLAVQTRSGAGAASQEKNINAQIEQQCLNTSNGYWNAANERVTVRGCQQIDDQALFYRNGRWVDARLMEKETEVPDRTVAFGTPEFAQVLDQLIAEGRQALIANSGEIYLSINNQRVLVQCP